MTDFSESPIFILGMLQRTGTNHLWDLLGLHPDTALLKPVFEDHLVRWTPHLVAFADDVSRRWSEEWQVPDSERDELLRALGGGVVAWVSAHAPGQRVVTKMPSVEQARNFFEVFPASPLVVLVRDGRSVCESGVRSFGWSYERAFRRWRNAARQVIALAAEYSGRDGFILVRYEDLVADPQRIVRDVCRAVGLDTDRFPYDEIESAPVLGSSVVRPVDGGSVGWQPVDKPESFNPLERWQSWEPHRHRRFAEVAGAEQRALGYGVTDAAGRSSLGDRARDGRDLVFDAWYREARMNLGRLVRAVRRVPGAI